MFHLSWDSFLVAYVVMVGAWLIARDVWDRRASRRADLEGRVTILQQRVASLSGEIQRLSSHPPPPPLSSPVLVIPRAGALPAPFSIADSDWVEEPTNPKMVAVEIIDDSGEIEVPITLRSGYAPAAE